MSILKVVQLTTLEVQLIMPFPDLELVRQEISLN